MSDDSGFTIATAVVDVKTDTTGVETAARIIAKHLNAMADDLKAHRESGTP